MLLLILACLLGVAVVPVIYLFAKVLRGKKNLEFYQQQGIPTLYSVTKGHMTVEDRGLPENAKKSNLEYVKMLVNRPDCKAAGAFAVNCLMRSQTVVHLHSSELIREYLLNEDDFDKVMVFPQLPKFLGFFYMNGDKAFRSKALFSKIFNPDGMDLFTPKICKLVNQVFAEFCQKHSIRKEEFSQISLDELYEPVMLGIANIFIFGIEEVKTGLEIDQLPSLLLNIMGGFIGLRKSIWSALLPFSVIKALGLGPEIRKIDAWWRKQLEIMKAYIEVRSKESKLGESVIDRCIIHNRECEREGRPQDILSVEEIVGNYNIFFFAGTDTSQNSTKNAICQMADRTNLKQFLNTVNKQIYDSEGSTTTQTLESCEPLTLWTKECLRMHGPVARSTLKLAKKNIKLGKYTILKGDIVVMAYTGMHHDKQFFADCESFDLSRFAKERETQLPRYQFIPFSLGKRVCLGRHLGELMLKLLTTKFVSHFEFERPEGVDYYTAAIITNTVLNPFVNVKLK